jgi:adenosylcobinamide-GDP ribazoletransferase
VALTAVRGAIGFLSRLPVGRSEAAWDSFRRTPTAIPVVGYLLGAGLALPLLLPLPDATTALVFVAGVYALTGITHVDGVADLGDALVVHGDAEDRRAVLKDTAVGTGALLSVLVVVAGLALAGLALADLPTRVAVALVITGEVGAKAALAGLVCVGDPAHEGLGSALTTNAGPRDAHAVVAHALPALLLAWPDSHLGVAVLLAAATVAGATYRWATTNLGGVSGDVFGATNELARVAGLHAGVVAWTLW